MFNKHRITAELVATGADTCVDCIHADYRTDDTIVVPVGE